MLDSRRRPVKRAAPTASFFVQAYAVKYELKSRKRRHFRGTLKVLIAGQLIRAVWMFPRRPGA
jgi:hypothetical protein